MRNILIIGGGPSGTFAAIAAKKQDSAATVTILTDEHCEPYEKPPLSKAVLLGKVLPADAPIAGPGGVAAHGVVLEVRSVVAAIDRDAHSVILQDGRRLAFDALVIATGSFAREIPLLPLGSRGVHYLRTEADADVLKNELRTNRDLLVVGGGLIGLEVAASAAKLGLRTTVLEVLPRILARVCDEETGVRVERAHRAHGVDIRVGTALAGVVHESNGRMTATTSTGEPITVDLVVVGTGAKPNDRLAVETGLATNDGILVDDQCRTSDPAIFAAGDVVRFPGPDGLVRLENWRHAQDQGTVAGRNAAGAAEAYCTVPSFWSEQYDLYIQGVGWPTLDGQRVRRHLSAENALVFEIRDGCLAYAMGINAQRDLAAARRLIERRTPVEAATLADPTKPLSALLKR